MSSRRPASLGGVIVALALAGGCASLDATTDLDVAADATRDRIGRSPAALSSSDVDVSIESWEGHEPLTPTLAIETALQRAPSVVAGRLNIAAARARFAADATPPNPVVRWMVGVPLDPVEAVPFLLGLSQDLALLLERGVMEEIARHRLDAEVLSIAETVVATAFDVRRAHAEAVAATERVQAREALLELARRRLREVEDRLAIGEASPIERDEFTAGVEAAAASLSADRRDRRVAMLRLLHAMGCPDRDLDFPLVASTASVSEIDLDPPSVTVDSQGDRPIERRLVEVAIDHRLDLLASDLEARAKLVEIGLAERSVWRGLSIGVGIDRDMEGMRGVPFSGAVPLPIFDDGRIAGAAALAAWRLALIDRVALIQRIEFEVRSAWGDLESSEVTLGHRRAEQQELERIATVTMERYEAGLTTLETVRRAERDTLAARIAVIDARLATEIAHLDLRRSIGGPLHGPIVASNSKVPADRRDPS